MNLNEKGYSLIEVLVALTLLIFLLFITVKVLGQISLDQTNHNKFQALKYAKTYMQETLLLRQYSDEKKKLCKGYSIHRIIKKVDSLILIEIKVYLKDKELAVIKAYDKI